MKFFNVILIFSLFVSCSTTTRVVKEFSVDIDSPKIEIGIIETQFNNLFAKTGLKKHEVTVLYYHNDDVVCLQYKKDFYTFYQFWDRQGRETFLSAFEAYKKDFEERNLKINRNKSRYQYAKLTGFLVWRMMEFTIKAKGSPQIDIGYFFKNKTPYFTVTQRETFYVDPIDRDDNRTADMNTFYFTRAQADDLAQLFDQNYLTSILPSKNSEEIVPPAIDEY